MVVGECIRSCSWRGRFAGRGRWCWCAGMVALGCATLSAVRPCSGSCTRRPCSSRPFRTVLSPCADATAPVLVYAPLVNATLTRPVARRVRSRQDDAHQHALLDRALRFEELHEAAPKAARQADRGRDHQGGARGEAVQDEAHRHRHARLRRLRQQPRLVGAHRRLHRRPARGVHAPGAAARAQGEDRPPRPRVPVLYPPDGPYVSAVCAALGVGVNGGR